ncbi:MAG: polyphosphate polymerase domain-containing protein [Clostridia bacterium]|nr:polyphosphate polymerase domain-containing protein [Clostridia bacterium]
MQTPHYRHEIKHQITQGQRMILESRLRALMKNDPHARADGTYYIRSLYFDNANDLALKEKVYGAAHREKFRIRYYNGDLSFIRLEKKSKINQLTDKQSAVITKKQCEALLAGDVDFLRTDSQPLMNELYAKMKLHGFHPKTVVDYERLTFIHPMGDTRVTLDYHIRTGIRSTDFLNPALSTLAADAVEEAPFCILEVKYDAFLPDCIRDALQLDGIRPTAFSKYEICRRFG